MTGDEFLAYITKNWIQVTPVIKQGGLSHWTAGKKNEKNFIPYAQLANGRTPLEAVENLVEGYTITRQD